jgi:hypothetical protein
MQGKRHTITPSRCDGVTLTSETSGLSGAAARVAGGWACGDYCQGSFRLALRSSIDATPKIDYIL